MPDAIGGPRLWCEVLKRFVATVPGPDAIAVGSELQLSTLRVARIPV